MAYRYNAEIFFWQIKGFGELCDRRVTAVRLVQDKEKASALQFSCLTSDLLKASGPDRCLNAVSYQLAVNTELGELAVSCDVSYFCQGCQERSTSKS
jgi:hypothetical protein